MSRTDVIVFAGTTEGRTLCETLCSMNIQVLMCVATDYGATLAKQHPCLTVRAGRLDEEEMRSLIQETGCSLVVDATHPYASRVSRNLQGACAASGAEYLRLLRESASVGEEAVVVPDMQSAACCLAEQGGTALLTVGSKELEAFISVPDYRRRLYVRTLPTTEAIQKCMDLGISPSQCICMQGPFTHTFNVELLRQLGVEWLVTKDTGDTGGFPQKVSAAREAGVRLLVVGRPEERVQGHSFDEIEQLLFLRLNREAYGKCATDSVPARFPLFVSLLNKRVVIVGGGNVASRRVRTLLQCAALVTVVAPEATAEIRALAADRTITWHSRAYQQGDLEGAVLAVAASSSRSVNLQVLQEGEQRHTPCSVADNARDGSFWFPALVQGRGVVAGLVSSDGDHSRVRSVAAELRERWGRA